LAGREPAGGGEPIGQVGRELGQRTFALQLALFRVGVGFLVIRAKPLSDDLDDWTDFLHYFRFVGGQRGVCVSARRRAGKDAAVPFFPEPAGGTSGHPDGCGLLSEVLHAVLGTGTDERDPGTWWTDLLAPNQLLPYAALFVHGLPKSDQPSFVYRVRNFFHAHQQLHPSPSDLREDDPGLLAYTDGQWFLHSLDGGSFVAFDPPDTPFFRQTLPSHLRDEYHLLFLLALHQRLALVSLSEEVARHWLAVEGPSADDQRDQAFQRIRDTLFVLTARGRFTQVMHREHHHRSYRRWRATFEIDNLFKDVSEEVRDMHAFLMLRRAERVGQELEAQRRRQQDEQVAAQERERAADRRARQLKTRVSQLGILIGIPALAISFLSTNVDAIQTLELWQAVLIILISVSVAVLVLIGLKLRNDR
jgi:hypothetical protein